MNKYARRAERVRIIRTRLSEIHKELRQLGLRWQDTTPNTASDVFYAADKVLDAVETLMIRETTPLG